MTEKLLTDPNEALNSSGTISSTSDFIMTPVEGLAQTTQKRSLEPVNADGEPPSKKVSKPTIRLGAGFEWNLEVKQIKEALSMAATAVQSGGKSPVSALNELGVKVSYTIVRQGGPAHCPSFIIAVNVADMKFEGWGHSKREARAAAARACLTNLLAKVGRSLPPSGTNQVTDFTSDDLPKGYQSMPESGPQQIRAPNVEIPREFQNNPVPVSNVEPLFGPAGPLTAVAKSPINLLYENYPGLSFVCTFGDGTSLDDPQGPTMALSHSMRFKVVCHINDDTFQGYGSSKKLAKLAAARAALAALQETPSAPVVVDPAAPPLPPTAGFLPQTLADHVGKLVNEKFSEIMSNDVAHSKRKVLAGIVITTNLSIKDARVIAVTTGTKCVSGEQMSVRGMAVNDCHAEVVARRCLQRHLYTQLQMYAKAKDPLAPIESSDLEPLPTGGYRLKPSRHVHLYVSTAPCGDGRIFSPHENMHSAPDKHPNRAARGQLRTKIESGEGTIPVKNCSNVIQTWDGVLQGERLLTMSCSDKVARWCVLGMQGALLSLLVQPVYLHSLVLGSLMHPQHMYRALCGRIEGTLSSLPPMFSLSRPQLARAASTEVRCPQRAPTHSVCWCAIQPEPEILNATTGKLDSGRPSLLCKQSMFARWQYLMKRLKPLSQQEEELDKALAMVPDQVENLLYSEAKQLCAPYQAAKGRMTQAFEKAKLGSWIKKPLEQDQFTCELTGADPNSLFA